MKCLIVEDDSTARRLLQIYLVNYGDCFIAADGREAVDAFRKALDQGQPYDLICLDIMLPEMDGQEVLEEIRRIEKERGIGGLDGVKVIMITALDDFGHVAGAFRTGCEAYLVKPIRKDEFIEEMQRLGFVESEVSK